MKPRLSVVVPVHNVEEYLRECLRSVAGRTGVAVEVVMVDDGSTDGSPRIAREFAERDPRFRYVRQENAGLSAARNTGVRHTTPGTPYLAFVDSDDVVAPDAYERMVASLDATGSDFATGNVWRLTEHGREQAWQYRWLTVTRERTHITRAPELLTDRVAWNKVFRRTFWDRHGFAFPEGRLYEDAPVMIPAHYLAESVDVLREHVYYWRVREGSITRRRTDVRGVRDRIRACEDVRGFLADRSLSSDRGAGQRRAYELSCLKDDFVYFLEGLPAGSPEYRSAFLAGTTAFLARADPRIIDGLPVDLRIKWRLVRDRRLTELLDVLVFEQRNGRGVFAVRRDRLGRRSAAYPEAPAARLRRGELPVVARLREARWADDGTLRLAGYAYIRNLGATAPHHSLKAGLLRGTGGGPLLRRVPTRTVYAPETTENSGQELHCYDLSGFEMTVDPKKLKAGAWLVGVVVAGHGVVRRAAVRALDAASAQPLVRDTGEGRRLVLDFRDGRATVEVREYAARVEGHRLDVDAVELTGRLFGGARPVALRIGGASTYPVAVSCDGKRFSVRIARADLAGAGVPQPPPHREPLEVVPPDGELRQAALELADGSPAEVAAAAEMAPGRYVLAGAAGRELCVTADAYGRLALELTRRPVVDRIAWDDRLAAVRIGGTVARGGRNAEPELELVLRHSATDDEVTAPVERHGGRFSTVFAPGGGALCEGSWYVFLREREGEPGSGSGQGNGQGLGGEPDRARKPSRGPGHGGEFGTGQDPAHGQFPGQGPGPGQGLGAEHGQGSEAGRRAGPHGRGVPLRVLAGALDGLPLHRWDRGREFSVDRRAGDRLLITAGSLLPPSERGVYRQHALRSAHYPAQRALPLLHAVLYFDGDSPRAVHEELVRRGTGIEQLWVAHDQQTRVPPTATAVELHSTAWYEALARCRRIVAAGHLPEWFERRDGQTVVQTWPGTPLWRIGTDLAGTLYADHRHLGALPRLARQWDVLVSPSRFATPGLRRALAYGGEVLEAGSPGNDLLFAPGRRKRAERVRRELGIEGGKRVVLYAPTFRDHLAYAPGRHRFGPALDLAAAERALGRDHVLLVRRHPQVTGSVPGARAPFARDVSGHPRTGELLLAADVLVTDYSSLMFDFAHTGRPMLFHTYDLEHYRDTVRGFTLDFEARAPGPLLRDTGELIGALRDLEALSARHAGAYASFRTDFCDLDDGGAAARVADRLLR
ncbi:CDP-glycerol glycerophosphotransferase family protein [Streptomyces sp. A3M-1-3]|uniref:bifunctional glycosyltransferase/CDP-glycerol:glycerophosphate glycerophosphotransferase n=1 Tax=Streptomyces sp. A3M-1-3 TaxID=2962044 RepID=UPI0020B8177D|nr:CDP-glycerol glycerophosphotransferase family protein [Streptomyces sp. A3M-1-3]MCP3822164.1 CDP-glycerol glycerophosphotransferase family protein [Streptomyces sp. A3M-1-3]